MIGILIMTIIAFVLGVILVILDNKTNKKSPSEIFLDYLPGYNCGTCGYAGCQGMAEALVKDKTAYKKCKLLKGEKLEELEKLLNN